MGRKWFRRETNADEAHSKRQLITGDPCAENLSIKRHQGLLKLHKYEDRYDQRGPCGTEIKGSFTSENLESPEQISLYYLCCFFYFVKCKSLYKSPSRIIFPLCYFNVFLLFWGKVLFSLQPSIYLTVLFLFFDLFTCTEKHFSSLLSGCKDDLTECC